MDGLLLGDVEASVYLRGFHHLKATRAVGMVAEVSQTIEFLVLPVTISNVPTSAIGVEGVSPNMKQIALHKPEVVVRRLAVLIFG